jgi:formylglycine-generating enzyme required for sulfatase activity
VAIDWVSIEGGTFEMGSRTGDSDELPVHTVTVRPFQMSRTEVTVAQWKACVDAGKCTAPATEEYCNWLVTGREAHPVNCVSWDQAVVFAQWAGGRLPTEAEWEYAARSGGKVQEWPWGTAEADCERAVVAGCGHTSTQPVCSLRAGNSAQGLCDMAGNVWEWVQDEWHADYTGAPVDGSTWASAAASDRVIRGGSWRLEPALARAAYRSWFRASYAGDFLGLRLARSE